MKRRILIGLIPIILLVLFRGSIYRMCFGYSAIGEREGIPLEDHNLLAQIDDYSMNQQMEIETIIELSIKLTNKTLRFSGQSGLMNPNIAARAGKANCVGYSALFHSIVTKLIKCSHLTNKYTAHHRIGQIDFLGLNVHRILINPFFSDHDYNEVMNLLTGERYYIDPTVCDYLKINRISVRGHSNDL